MTELSAVNFILAGAMLPQKYHRLAYRSKAFPFTINNYDRLYLKFTWSFQLAGYADVDWTRDLIETQDI